MRAFIFAAGLGTRLKPFTEHHPKALVPVCGVPMLQRVILKLKNAGIKDFVINVHHFAQQIIDFLAQNDNFGVNILISHEVEHPMETGGALLYAANLFKGEEPILIHNADILTDFDVNEMLAKHEKYGADATLLVAHRESSRQIYFDRNTHVLHGWRNLKTGESIPENFTDYDDYDSCAFGGVHIINPSVLQEIRHYATTDVFPIFPFYLSAISRLKIVSFMPEKPYNWFDIGKPETLQKAEDSLRLLEHEK